LYLKTFPSKVTQHSWQMIAMKNAVGSGNVNRKYKTQKLWHFHLRNRRRLIRALKARQGQRVEREKKAARARFFRTKKRCVCIMHGFVLVWSAERASTKVQSRRRWSAGAGDMNLTATRMHAALSGRDKMGWVCVVWPGADW
jgi:hypothetical protein